MKKKRIRNSVKISKLILFGVLFLFIVMIARLSQLALSKNIDGVNLKELASQRTTRTETLTATRGTIYTSDNEAVAQNVSSYTIIAYLDPKRSENENSPQHVVDKENTAKLLAPILEMEEKEILTLLSKENVYQTEFGTKGKGLTEITKDKIEALNLPGIDFVEYQKRYYPKGDFLSYTLGYAKTVVDEETGKEDIIGELGLEKYYDDILRGQDGKVTYQKDLRGYKIAGTNEVREEAINGKDIYLTIDSNIQFFVEQSLKNAKDSTGFEWFTMMVADAKTGKILASTSTPSFDPNIRNLTNYLDPNVSFTYEPGSTMKIYTYMATLENGNYDGNETFLSGTYTTSDGTIIGDWNRNGWGTITYDKGFMMSSNVGIVNLINNKINSKILRQYFKKLGFGAKTGITLPQEAEGKINFKYETEIYNAGFGQGITTTPIQNIQALTSLTNDGMLLEPYIVDKIVDPVTGEVTYEGKRKEIDQVASSDTVNKIKQLMYETVNGTGNTGINYHIDGYDLIGKTGTAQIADESGNGYLTGDSDIISSFAGIYPMDNPEIIIYASMKRPDGGSQRPIQNAVKEVIVNISKYLGKEESQTTVEKITNYTLPSFINKKIETVTETLNSNGINSIIIGDGNKVTNHYPEKNTVITSKDKVFLITNGSNRTLTNMFEWSVKEVETYLNLLGIKYKLEGNGYVINQSIGANTTVNDETEVIITLAPKYDT